LNPDLKPLIVEYLGIRPGWRIVDVGCGTGAFTRYLAEALADASADAGTSAFEDCSLIGIDNDARFIETAKKIAGQKKPGKSLEFIVADAHDLPFPSSCFDLVVSHTLLGSVRDPNRAMIEMKRVARDGKTIASVTSMSLGHQAMHGGYYPPECLWTGRLAELEQKVWAMYQSHSPLALFTGGVSTAEIPHMFSVHGIANICIYPIGRVFSLSNAAMPAEEKKEYILGMYEAEIEKINTFWRIEASREHLKDEEYDEYLELLGRKKDFLLNSIGENSIWEWHGGANLLIVGKVEKKQSP
ncbi:MAG TPA: class I SAM-dependent methyltransferase, partial [Spirochaetia bacterium]|nr:class I SAM-dependent methyltransferase [Spirochaetia bacterium]